MKKIDVSSARNMNGGCNSSACMKHYKHLQYCSYQGSKSKKNRVFFFFDGGTEWSGKYYCTRCHKMWWTGFHW